MLGQVEKNISNASLLLFGDAHAADSELEELRYREESRPLLFQARSGIEAEETLKCLTSEVVSAALLKG